jgi:hypothetical protein
MSPGILVAETSALVRTPSAWHQKPVPHRMRACGIASSLSGMKRAGRRLLLATSSQKIASRSADMPFPGGQRIGVTASFRSGAGRPIDAAGTSGALWQAICTHDLVRTTVDAEQLVSAGPVDRLAVVTRGQRGVVHLDR